MKYTLRMLHASKFWTQAQAAKEIGVSTETWGNWERKRSYPDVPNISKIEQVFNVAYDDIIFQLITAKPWLNVVQERRKNK